MTMYLLRVWTHKRISIGTPFVSVRKVIIWESNKIYNKICTASPIKRERKAGDTKSREDTESPQERKKKAEKTALWGIWERMDD